MSVCLISDLLKFISKEVVVKMVYVFKLSNLSTYSYATDKPFILLKNNET